MIRGRFTWLGVILACALIGPATASAGSPPAISNAGSLPAISISGNQFMAGGKVVRLIGVDRSGTEYACTPGDDDGIFQGPVDQSSVTAMLGWDINVVQLPLNEACWLGSSGPTGYTTGAYGDLNPDYSGLAYQQAIENYVALLNANGIYVSLNLSGAAPGNNVYTPNQDNDGDYAEAPLADSDHSVAFWTSVATVFASNDDVLFHVYDEPNSLTGSEGATAWACVENGCTVDDEYASGANTVQRYGSYTGVGSQALVNAIRDAGATTQPILVSGPNYAGDLSEWLKYIPTDPSNEIGAVIDSFDYTDNFCPADPGSCDDQSQNMVTVAASHPVVIGGFGENDCNPSTGFSDGLMNFADQHGISYIAWTWDTNQDYGNCNNALLNNASGNDDDSAYEDGNPSTYGAIIRSHYQALAAAAAGAGGGSTGSSGSTGAASTSAGSGATMPGSLSAPQNTVAPVLAGSRVVGRTLSCSSGTWLESPMSFTYQWLRDGTAIAGATHAVYVITRADQGHRLACAVTASNGLTAEIQSAQQSISAAGTLGRVSVRHGTVSASVGCGTSNPGSCRITLSLSAVRPTFGLGVARTTLRPGAHRTLTLELNRGGRRLIAARHEVTARLRVTERVGGAPALQIAAATVKLTRNAG